MNYLNFTPIHLPNSIGSNAAEISIFEDENVRYLKLKNADLSDYFNLYESYKCNGLILLYNYVVTIDLCLIKNTDELKSLNITAPENSKVFAKDILRFDKLTNLSILDKLPENFPSFSNFKLLKQINISLSNSNNFDFLNVVNIQKINLYEFKNRKVEDLCVMKNLSYLNIVNSDFERIDFIDSFTNLTSLIIKDNINIKEINFSFLTAIKELQLIDLNIKKIISCLNDAKLTDLKIKNCLSLSDVSGFVCLKKLKNIEIDGVNIQSLESLRNCTELKNLKIINCNSLIDISSVKYLKNLETIHINNCTDNLDYSGIINCKKLKNVEIGVVKNIYFANECEYIDSFIYSLPSL